MAQPAMAEARVSCPVCRAPVHPIAGRCKHCKADLVRARGGTTGAGETPVSIPPIGAGGAPAAAPLPLPGGRGAPMPSLAGATVPGPVSTLPSGPSMTPPIAAPATPMSTTSMSTAASAPVIAATGHAVGLPAVTTATRARGGWSHRWPLVVAIVAAIAIVVSLAVLLFGGDDARRKTARPLGPAPDRMNTDTGPPAPPLVPRATPQPPSRMPDPSAPAPADPPPSAQAPDDPSAPSPDLSDPFDPAPSPGADPQVTPVPPRGATGVPRVSSAGEFVDAAIDVACERVLGCLGSSDQAQSLCRQARAMGSQMSGALSLACTQFDAGAAQQCLSAIARLPCPKNDAIDPTQLARLAAAVPACSRMCGP